MFLKDIQEDYNEAQQEAIDLQSQRQKLVESLFGGKDPNAETDPITPDTTTTGDSKATKKTAEELEKQRKLYFEHERLKIMILMDGEERELALIDLKYEKEKQKLTEAGLTEAQILEANERDKEAIRQKYREKEEKAEDKKQRELKKLRDAEAKYDKEQLKKKKEDAEKEAEINNSRFDSAASLVNSTIALLDRDEKSRRKNGKLIKALAIAEIAINT